MEKTYFMSCLILSLAAVVLPFKHSEIRVYTMPVLGVFEVAFMPAPNKMTYGFNASQAREVCESLHVTIASKKQVEEANQRGLETCRFGWTDEGIAVIPRISPSMACGQNRIGLVIWRASATKPFDVFCFNSTASEIPLDASVAPVGTKQASETSSSPPSPPSLRLPQSTRSTPFISPSLSPSTVPAHPHQPVGSQSTESSFRVVPAAVIITVVTVLLLIAFAALWRYRKSKDSIPFWKRESKKNCTETEVWKSTCEQELNQEEKDGNNSNTSRSVDPEAQTQTV